MWLEGVSEESRGRQGQVLMGRALEAMGRLACTFTPSEVGAIEDSEQRRNGKPGNLGGADSKESPCPESHRVVGWKYLQGFPPSFFSGGRVCPHTLASTISCLETLGLQFSPLSYVVFSGWHLP